MKTTKELRSLSEQQLTDELLSLRREQFNLRLKRANGSLDKPHMINLIRKAVARVKTIMTEKGGKSHVK
jgi:large subunit ribosomal protein L29